MKDSEDQGIWKKIPVIGKTPGKRYGHSLAFMKPYFVLFGGNINSHVSNDVWIISLDNIIRFSFHHIFRYKLLIQKRIVQQDNHLNVNLQISADKL